MSFSKVLCAAVVGSILCSGIAMARPDTTGQPPATQIAKAHHKHKHAKLRKLLRKHQQKKHAPGKHSKTQPSIPGQPQ